MVGMHTYDDAFLYVGKGNVTEGKVNVLDIAPTVFDLIDESIAAKFDGKSLVI
jgi:arylsulfatase A-like enzyme